MGRRPSVPAASWRFVCLSANGAYNARRCAHENGGNDAGLAGDRVCVVCGVGIRAGLPEPDHPHAGRLSGRRPERRAGAHHRREAARCARPAGDRREQDRRGRHDRAQRDAGAAARRAHAAALLLYRCDQSAALQEGRLQARGCRAGLADPEGVLRLHDPRRVSGERPERLHRARQGQARRAQLRQGRLGLGHRIAGEAVREDRRHPDDRRDLPRHRPCHPGGRGGPPRLHGRAACGHHAAA